jgi:hypothetical protein
MLGETVGAVEIDVGRVVECALDAETDTAAAGAGAGVCSGSRAPAPSTVLLLRSRDDVLTALGTAGGAPASSRDWPLLPLAPSNGAAALLRAVFGADAKVDEVAVPGAVKNKGEALADGITDDAARVLCWIETGAAALTGDPAAVTAFVPALPAPAPADAEAAAGGSRSGEYLIEMMRCAVIGGVGDCIASFFIASFPSQLSRFWRTRRVSIRELL